MADPYSAGQVLGSALFGNTRGTYNDELGRAYKVEQALQQARKSRSDAILANDLNDQRFQITPELMARYRAGDVDATNQLITAGIRGNDKLDFSTLGDIEGATYRRDAVNRATLGDWDGANASMLGVANGPQELAAVQGQNLINNRFREGGGGISTTEQGRAGMAADAARAAASYASANSSNASAARTRQAAALDRADVLGGGGGGPSSMAPSGYRWTQGGGLEAIPGGPADKAGGGVDGGLLGDLNPRQKTGAQSVQRNLLSYAAALTGTPESELRKLSADEIASLMESKGGRGFQGGIARFLRNVPGGQTLGDVLNSDILSYSQGAGAGLAAYENPSGPISNADRETSTLQMPTYLDPVGVQANKTRNFLESTGYQPSGAAVLGERPANSRIQPAAALTESAAPVQRARNPATGQVLVLRNGQWVPE